MTDKINPTSESDVLYMRRALRLAAFGAGSVSPNPQVGAVVVARGRIIGEGWHRAYGGPHAEVNAIASIAESDLHLLPESTIYVTLEPCSHWGKTPPCASLIIEKGIPNVVVGAPDPNPLVAGRGIRMLREAGISVKENVLLKECLEINRRFMTAQIKRRPWIQLKYAVSADGFMAGADPEKRLMISNPLSSTLMHRERAMADAIFAGTATVILDNPSLDCRLWPGRNPVKLSFNSSRLPSGCKLLQQPHILTEKGETLPEFLHRLQADHKIESVMVEGGATTLRSFIEADLWDEIRIERSPVEVVTGLRAPAVPEWAVLTEEEHCRGNIISRFRHPDSLPPIVKKN